MTLATCRSHDVSSDATIAASVECNEVEQESNTLTDRKSSTPTRSQGDATATSSVVNVLRELKRSDEERTFELTPNKKSRLEASQAENISAAPRPTHIDTSAAGLHTLPKPTLTSSSDVTAPNIAGAVTAVTKPMSPILTPIQQRLVSSFESDHNYQTPASRIGRTKPESPQMFHAVSAPPMLQPSSGMTRTLAEVKKRIRDKVSRTAADVGRARTSAAASAIAQQPVASAQEPRPRISSAVTGEGRSASEPLTSILQTSQSTSSPVSLATVYSNLGSTAVRSTASLSASLSSSASFSRGMTMATIADPRPPSRTPETVIITSQPNQVDLMTSSTSNTTSSSPQYIVINSKNSQPAGAASRSPSSFAHQPVKSESELKGELASSSQNRQDASRSQPATAQAEPSSSSTKSKVKEGEPSEKSETPHIPKSAPVQQNSNTSVSPSTVKTSNTAGPSKLKIVLVKQGESNYSVRKPQSDEKRSTMSADTKIKTVKSKAESVREDVNPVTKSGNISESSSSAKTPVKDVYDFDTSSNDVASVTLTPPKPRSSLSRSHQTLQKLLTSDSHQSGSPRHNRSSPLTPSSTPNFGSAHSPSANIVFKNLKTESTRPASVAAAVSLSSPEKSSVQRLPSSPCSGSVLQSQNLNRAVEDASAQEAPPIYNQKVLDHER